MCVCVCVCLCVCASVSIHVHMCLSMSACGFVDVFVHLCVCLCMRFGHCFYNAHTQKGYCANKYIPFCVAFSVVILNIETNYGCFCWTKH